MMTRWARPVLASVCRNPSDIASTDTRTPTTPAMPTTTTSEVPSRWGIVRRLIAVIRAICVRSMGAAQRCPASASTIRSRFTRHAGGRPMTSARASATAAAQLQVSALTKSGGKRPPVVR